MNAIAVNIKHLRQERGLSQQEFAQALHVTRQTVSAWERGVSQPGLDTLEEMARVLDVETERLLYGGLEKRSFTYRRVSFWPVVVMIPLFFIAVFGLLPLLLGMVANRDTDAVYLLGGQLFLAMVLMFCCCTVKDEIRNREYYKKEDEEFPPEE